MRRKRSGPREVPHACYWCGSGFSLTLLATSVACAEARVEDLGRVRGERARKLFAEDRENFRRTWRDGGRAVTGVSGSVQPQGRLAANRRAQALAYDPPEILHPLFGASRFVVSHNDSAETVPRPSHRRRTIRSR